jgi:hypothetical protein
MIVGMSRTALAVNLNAEDSVQLERWASAPGTPQVALRCRLVLAAWKGQEDQEIAFEEAVGDNRKGTKSNNDGSL